MIREKIYCDSASATPIDKTVGRAMKKARAVFYNPSSIYSKGKEAADFLLSNRKKIASILLAKPDEIIFTGGGTEGNNIAIQGTVNSLLEGGNNMSDFNIVTSEIEHSSVMNVCKSLSKKGLGLSLVSVKENGAVDINDLKGKINSSTVLVSIIYVNNEVGTVEPIREISLVVKKERERREKEGIKTPIYFHTDASQAPLVLSIVANSLGADLITFDGGKIYGPKNSGVLFVKSGVKISPVMFGGGQEKGLRPGTENLELIAGFTKALELASRRRLKFIAKQERIKKVFVEEVKKLMPEAKINGYLENSVPHIANVHIPGIDAEYTLLKLDSLGVECATKSSCMKGEEESYVIYSIYKDHARAKESLRFSFLKSMTAGKAKKVAQKLKSVVK